MTMKQIIQLTAGPAGDPGGTLLFALCADGTLWRKRFHPDIQYPWDEVPGIAGEPEDGAGNAGSTWNTKADDGFEYVTEVEAHLDAPDAHNEGGDIAKQVHEFGHTVLRVLEEDEDWGADTLDTIDNCARSLNLAQTGNEGHFQRNPDVMPDARQYQDGCDDELDEPDDDSDDKTPDEIIEQTIDDALCDLLWRNLRSDPCHPDTRVCTGWGSKTSVGLAASIKRIVREGAQLGKG